MMLRLLIAVALPLIYILKSNAYGQNLSESSYLDRQLLFETSNEELITKKENLPIDRTNVILYAQEFKEGLNAFSKNPPSKEGGFALTPLKGACLIYQSHLRLFFQLTLFILMAYIAPNYFLIHANSIYKITSLPKMITPHFILS